MVANQATVETNPADAALELIRRIDALATSGEWQRIERLVARVREVILEIPEYQRESAVTEMSHCLARARCKALASRGEVKEKLSDIKRGRVATAAYRQPRKHEPGRVLR